MRKTPKYELGGNLLRERRRELRMTLKDVAGRVGCCFSYISDMEKGQKRPAYGTAELLADVLGLPLDDVCCAFGIVPPDVARLVTSSPATLDHVRNMLGASA